MQTLLVAAQNSVPQKELAVATAAASFLRSIGGSLGVTMFQVRAQLSTETLLCYDAFFGIVCGCMDLLLLTTGSRTQRFSSTTRCLLAEMPAARATAR